MLAAFRFRELGQQQRQFHVLIGGEHRNKVIHLENKTNMPSTPLRKLAPRHVRDFVAVYGDAAGRGNVEAAKQIE